MWWHYMVLGCFWPFSSKLFMIFCWFLLFEPSLLFTNIQWKFKLFSGPLLVQNLAIFTQNQVFGHFLRNRTLDLSKTWSETWDNCFESSNGIVVSRKILLIIIIIIFKALRLAAVVFMCFFNLAAAERPQHCALV